ncbi:MAG: bifunctional UDP-N-acetylglucosamine diphosphorylase/glucosamine-1-phosphate N-acetyltransferase GlmU [Acidimicrobiia bacterium]
MSVDVIVLAAGKGTRMNTGLAKVLHEAAGRSLLGWALASLDSIDVGDISIVVGHQADDVRDMCPPTTSVVIQEPQEGTGHAAMVGRTGLKGGGTDVLVLPGDMPLITAETLASLVADHQQSNAAATVLSVRVEDPYGYGRIVRDNGDVTGIVEERDATDDQRGIDEVNTSVYVFNAEALEKGLSRISNDNAQGEYYLTDVIGELRADGLTVGAVIGDAVEGHGVNTQAQLAEAAAILRSRINAELLDAGVWMLDPSRVYIDATATVAPGARLFPDTYLRGASSVASGAEVGPHVQLEDTTVAAGATIQNAVAISAEVGEQATVGPFAYLRPGTVLKANAKVGTYVEVKGSEIGQGSKIPHLSYIGDASIGAGSNVGAGTITVNYDGYAKHKTQIGDNVRIGSDTMLVAPVSIGNDAFTGAGSVITEDVPEGALAVERTPQKNVDGYADKRRRRAEGNES